MNEEDNRALCQGYRPRLIIIKQLFIAEISSARTTTNDQ